jgi:hypothetical protein
VWKGLCLRNSEGLDCQNRRNCQKIQIKFLQRINADIRGSNRKTLPLICADDADLKLPKLPVLPKLPRLKIEADRSGQRKFQLPAILEGSSNVAALQFWQSWQSWQFWQLIEAVQHFH